MSATAMVILEVIKLGVEGLELSQIGDEEGANAKLRQVQQRSAEANQAWEDAAQPGDDVG